MTKLVACCLGAILALPSTATGQLRPHLVAGTVAAGIAESVDPWSPRSDYRYRRGVVVGAGVHQVLRGRLSFAPELLHVAKGVRVEDADARLRFGYLQLPLLLRQAIPVTGAVQPYITAGPVVSVLLHCTYDGGLGGEPCDSRYAPDDAYRDLDVGLVVGGGLQFGRLGVALRYEHGVRNIAQGSGDVRNRAILVVLTYVP